MDLNEKEIGRIVGDVIGRLNERSSEPPGSASFQTPVTAKSGLAAVLKSARELAIIEFPLREIGPDEILVKVEACGVCGTDIHCSQWTQVIKLPAYVSSCER